MSWTFGVWRNLEEPGGIDDLEGVGGMKTLGEY